MELAQRRQLEAFKSSIPSLQVAASFACSVASLSRSPAFQLPGHHHLHGEVLADHQFDWGGLSTCTAAHAQCLLTPSPSQNLQELPPSTKSKKLTKNLYINDRKEEARETYLFHLLFLVGESMVCKSVFFGTDLSLALNGVLRSLEDKSSA